MDQIHKLENTWVLFLQYKNLSHNYKGNVEKLLEIDTVQDFWRTFNNIPSIENTFSNGTGTKIMKRNGATPSSYSFFRKDIEPFWEDVENINGFEFSFRLSENVNKIWLHCLIELISERDDFYDFINGIRIVDSTKGRSVLYRLEFWFKTIEVKDIAEKIIKKNFSLENFNFSCRLHQNLKEK